jgi:iron complex transport system permease protein
MPLIVVLLAGVLTVSVLLAIALGAAAVPPGETLRFLWAAVTGGSITADDVAAYQIIWQVRTPRVLLAVLVGAGLSVVGVAIQAMVRNALADPFVLGVSSGASAGAVLVSATGALTALGIYAVSAGAFLGALLVSALVYLASRGAGGLTPLRLVLTGVRLVEHRPRREAPPVLRGSDRRSASAMPPTFDSQSTRQIMYPIMV